MKTISIIYQIFSFSAPMLLLLSCGTQTKQEYSRPKSVLETCRPGNSKPAIYYHEVIASDGSGPAQTVYALGVENNLCELRFIPLDQACTQSDIRAMTGLNTSPLVAMNEEQWSSFATRSEQGLAQRDLYQPISCHKKVDAGLEHPELHMITGDNGYSSLEIQSKKAEGLKTHYVTANSCWSFSRKLGVMARAADHEKPELFKPLSLNPGDEALYLTCTQESSPYQNPDGWNLFRDGDIEARQYIARYYVGGKFDQVELIIDKIDHEYPSEQNVKDFELKLAKTFQTRVSRIVPGTRMSRSEHYLTLDLCVNTCGETPAHTYWTGGFGYPYSVQPELTAPNDLETIAKMPKSSELRRWYSPTAEAIDYLEVKMPEAKGASPAADEATERWTFASCDASTDLRSRFGFHLNSDNIPLDWFEKNEKARQETRIGPFTRIPCVGEQVCRKIIKNGSNLSNTGSSRYNGLSLLTQRPADITDVCTNARKLELIFEGDATVDLRSWKVGNIPGGVPFEEITLKGSITEGKKSVLTLKDDCKNTSPCSSPVEPIVALEFAGDARFNVEGIDFKTTLKPNSRRSIAIRSQGTAKKPRIHLQNLNILAEDTAFHTGIELTSSEGYLLDSSVTGYYRGIIASNSLVAINGRPGSADLKSLVRLVLPNDSWPEPMPGQPFFDASQARGIELDGSNAYVLRTKIDAPKAIASKAASDGRRNQIAVHGSELQNSASKIPGAAIYIQGPLSATVSMSFVHDTQALVEFLDTNNVGSKIDFQGFKEDSFVLYKEPVVNLGNSNINVTRCAEFAEKRCYLQ